LSILDTPAHSEHVSLSTNSCVKGDHWHHVEFNAIYKIAFVA